MGSAFVYSFLFRKNRTELCCPLPIKTLEQARIKNTSERAEFLFYHLCKQELEIKESSLSLSLSFFY
ncbi:hypothetical protein AXF42_Ash009067 [Apostasia shenzhenica]|uniref:Uncharacterized protein n=1 Tax=Apostasia shenzhenica TaxID=1088818 RepID=A0A2I0ADD6_9ASPA|nr:hypothetical protein AXF42_Ash009067 [Apostasia shenzhenica]